MRGISDEHGQGGGEDEEGGRTRSSGAGDEFAVQEADEGVGDEVDGVEDVRCRALYLGLLARCFTVEMDLTLPSSLSIVIEEYSRLQHEYYNFSNLVLPVLEAVANCVTTEAVHLGNSTIMGYASLVEEEDLGV